MEPVGGKMLWLIVVLCECNLVRTFSFIVQLVGTLDLDLGVVLG